MSLLREEESMTMRLSKDEEPIGNNDGISVILFRFPHIARSTQFESVSEYIQ
jgi:hypothetical protein